MKKTLIALTLATLPVASMAEVVLYGKISGGVEVTKEKGIKGTTTHIVDYGSRIGFKGKEQLNDSLKAIWQLEQKVDIAGGLFGKETVDSKGKKTNINGFGTRDSFIGVESPAGTVKAGYMQTPLGNVNDKLDQWDYKVSDAAGLDNFTRPTAVVGRRVGVSYTTPDVAGFTATGFFAPADNERLRERNDVPAGDMNRQFTGKGDNRRLDRASYGVSTSYQQPGGGFFADVAAGYKKNAVENHDVKADKKLRHAYQAVAQVGYNTDNTMFGVAYQQAENVDADLARSQEVAASAAYTINNALTLKGSAAYGFNQKKWDAVGTSNQKLVKAYGNGKYMQGIVGADYNLSKRTTVNSQVGYIQYGKKEDKNAKGTVGVGMTHKF